MKYLSELSEIDRRVADLPAEIPKGRFAIVVQSLFYQKRIVEILELTEELHVELGREILQETLQWVLATLGSGEESELIDFLDKNTFPRITPEIVTEQVQKFYYKKTAGTTV